MNKWVQKSINLAKSRGYLDRLIEIYPVKESGREKFVEKVSPTLKLLFRQKKCKKLLKELIKLKKEGFKFPIENPYIGFLTHYEDAIDNNPKTIRIICRSLFKMSYEELKERMEEQKKASRRMGQMFRKWLRKKFDFLDANEFCKVRNKVVFLDGGDKFLKKYAQEELKCKFGELSKGLDFVAKIYQNRYIIGTAKFITDFGGSQYNQFNEAISLIKYTQSPDNVVKVAIIDGVAWLGGKMKDILEKLTENEFSLSALLLEEFFNDLT